MRSAGKSLPRPLTAIYPQLKPSGSASHKLPDVYLVIINPRDVHFRAEVLDHYGHSELDSSLAVVTAAVLSSGYKTLCHRVFAIVTTFPGRHFSSMRPHLFLKYKRVIAIELTM